MMRRISLMIALAIWLAPHAAFATEWAGQVIFVNGSVKISRGGKLVNAALKTPAMKGDTVVTGKRSTAKILFPDDSLLTVRPDTSVEITEYLFDAKKSRAASLFRLLAGKVRAVVGRASFSIKTQTAVAGARGTVFEVAYNEQTRITMVSVIEGIVELRNVNPAVSGLRVVTAGQSSSVPEGRSPSAPAPTPPPSSGTSGQKSDSAQQADGGSGDGSQTELNDSAIPAVQGPVSGAPGGAPADVTGTTTPDISDTAGTTGQTTIDLQPAVTPVDIKVLFP
jgi:hypothetical protein